MSSLNNHLPEHIKLLSSIFKKLNIEEKYYDKIYSYLELLLEKNQELNLISRKLDLNSIILDHIFDCLGPSVFFKKYSSITDAGTGSGLPGLLLSIIYPDKKITLIEKSPKKALFLKDAIKILNLNNTIVYNGLINEYKITSEIVTCRAFKPIDIILQLTCSFFNKNGTYLLYKGKKDKINEEIKNSLKRYKFDYKIIKLDLFKDKERHMVMIQKNRQI